MPAIIPEHTQQTEEEESPLAILFEPGEMDEDGIDYNPVFLPEYAHLEKEWAEMAKKSLDQYRADPSIALTDEQVGEELARRRAKRAAL